VDYHDLADPSERERFPEIVRAIEVDKLILPLVTIDGEMKLEGRADYWPITSLIDEKLAKKQPE
jgi:disulfide oxidoreductase YuzD